MPSAPPLETVSISPTVELARDGFGNALGGIRLSQMDVPIAVHSGTNSGPGACPRWGFTLDFDEQILATLHPTHAGYVSDVSDVNDRNVLDGFLLAPDAQRTLEEAEQSNVPEPDTWVAGMVAGLALASLCATRMSSKSSPL